MSTQMNASPDKAALATVLNYLRNKKLKVHDYKYVTVYYEI